MAASAPFHALHLLSFTSVLRKQYHFKDTGTYQTQVFWKTWERNQSGGMAFINPLKEIDLAGDLSLGWAGDLSLG